MLCPFCMLEYTVEAPCFCHAVVGASQAAEVSAPLILDVVMPTGELNMAMLAHFDGTSAAPYLGA